MTFKLSAFPPYHNAIAAKQSGDLATARVEFEKCVEATRAAGGNPTICGLLFWLGDVEAMDGNREVALQRYDEAMAADPDSPLALIYYAESLLRQLGEPTLALEKLQEAEALLVSGRWHETEDDLSREQYTSRIAETRAEISPTSDAA